MATNPRKNDRKSIQEWRGGLKQWCRLTQILNIGGLLLLGQFLSCQWFQRARETGLSTRQNNQGSKKKARGRTGNDKREFTWIGAIWWLFGLFICARGCPPVRGFAWSLGLCANGFSVVEIESDQFLSRTHARG